MSDFDDIPQLDGGNFTDPRIAALRARVAKLEEEIAEQSKEVTNAQWSLRRAGRTGRRHPRSRGEAGGGAEIDPQVCGRA